jgi:hypothetical protein
MVAKNNNELGTYGKKEAGAKKKQRGPVSKLDNRRI